MVSRYSVIYTVLLYSIFVCPPIKGRAESPSYVLPEELSVDNALCIPYAQGVLIKYERLFQAMEQGEVALIQDRSIDLLQYLINIKEAQVSHLIAPSIVYLKAMSKAMQYKTQRALFPFMVAPLLNFVPQSCAYADNEAMSQCKNKKRKYTYMLTVLPKLRVPQDTYAILASVLEQYQYIHLALYSADMLTVVQSSKALDAKLQEIRFNPLMPYIQDISSTITPLCIKKDIKEQVQLFHELTRKINTLLKIIQ